MTNVITGGAGRPAQAGAGLSFPLTWTASLAFAQLAMRWGRGGPCLSEASPTRLQNPLWGLQEFQPEYDELQVETRYPRQQGHRRNKDAGKREGT